MTPRVVVVGAGAAGCYTARALLRADPDIRVDVLERLPSPHGLVRYGVAPDHPVVKSKTLTFDTVLADSRVRYFGHVTFGRDVTREDLLGLYDAVVYAAGAAAARRLEVPGENLRGSLPARSFVAWYNAHPEFGDLHPPLDHRDAVVVGTGNVALDVTRMLVTDRRRLASTDMSPAAVSALMASRIRRITIMGRRGPSETSFTPKEVREIAELPGVRFVVDPSDVEGEGSLPFGDDLAGRRARRAAQMFREFAEARPTRRVRYEITMRFFTAPTAVLGEDRVTAVAAQRTTVVDRDDRRVVEPLAATLTVPAGLLLAAVGYRGEPLTGVPFDERRGVVPSRDGRVHDGIAAYPREYVTGWLRRGPHGVIGTNKVDGEEVAGHILADLAAVPATSRPVPATSDLADLLAGRGVDVVDWAQWQAVAAWERRAGSRLHRRALKAATTADMLHHARPRPASGGAVA